MKRIMLAVVVLAAVVAVLLTVNHRKGSELTPVPEEALQVLLQASLAEVDGLRQEQGDSAAVVRLREMLKQPAYVEIREPLFRRLLEVQMESADPVELLKTYVAFGEMDEALALAGFNVAIQAVMQAGDSQSRADGLEGMIAATKLPLQVRTTAWQHRMALYAQEGSVAGAAGRVDAIMDSDLSADARAIFSVAVAQGLGIPDTDGVEALLAAIEAHAGADDNLNVFVQLARGELLLAREMPEAAWDHYLAQADVVGDAELSRRLPFVLKVAKGLSRPELLARVVEAAYQRGEVFPLTRDAAAVVSVREAADSGNVAVLLDAARAALDCGANAARFYHTFSRGFYATISQATQDERTAMAELLQRFAGIAGLSDAMRGMIASARLDVAFFDEDFKSALAIIEAGVPGFDEAWHAELRDKVGAHLAQQEGRLEDAVALYRKHMERVLAWEKPVVNPENNQQMIKEVVLGFNEKRIGDIWSGVPGREADAQVAYAKAREWYAKGLELLKKDSPEYAEASAELAAVPAAE